MCSHNNKVNKKVTLEFYLRINMLSSDQRNRTLGMLACGLTYSEVACRHGCSHQAISSLASTTCRQQITCHDQRNRQSPQISQIDSSSSVGQVSYHKPQSYCNAWVHQPANQQLNCKKEASQQLRVWKETYRGSILSPVHCQNRLVWWQQHLRWPYLCCHSHALDALFTVIM